MLNNNNEKKILIVDDHELIRHGVQVVLQKQPGWRVCGFAESGREGVDKAKELKPDIIIMDLSMPDLNGLEATRQILAVLPDTEVLILTANNAEELVNEVVQAGAKGYILKSDLGRVLIEAIKALLDHKTYYTSEIAEKLAIEGINPDSGAAPYSTLTPREREVVQLIAEGKSTKEVADILKISLKTADTHRTNVMRKLGLHSVTDLVRYAVRNRIIQA